VASLEHTSWGRKHVTCSKRGIPHKTFEKWCCPEAFMPQPIPVKHQFLSETRSNYIRIWSLQQAIGYWVNDKLKKSAGLLFQDTPALAKTCPETNLLLDTHPNYTTYPMVFIVINADLSKKWYGLQFIK
jgi:hypothetical protein